MLAIQRPLQLYYKNGVIFIHKALYKTPNGDIRIAV